MQVGPQGGWGSFTSGHEKIFQTRIERQGQGLGGGARCEDFEGPCSALLPCERKSEGEKNETLSEHERLQVSIHHEMKLYGNEYQMWYNDINLKDLETTAHKMTHFRACYLRYVMTQQRQCGVSCILQLSKTKLGVSTAWVQNAQFKNNYFFLTIALLLWV